MDKKVILVVDDAADNIQLLSGVLKAHYKVKAATNGEKALTIAQKTPAPDLILLDVIMPGMDGFEVCQKLKEDDQTAGIPVIFVSGNFSDDDKQRGEDLGAAGFVGKPIDSNKLLEMISGFLA